MTAVQELALFVIGAIALGGTVFSLLGLLRSNKTSESFEFRSFEAALLKLPTALREEISQLRDENERRASDLRQELLTSIKTLTDGLALAQKESSERLADSQTTKLSETNKVVRDLAERLEQQQVENRKTTVEALEKIRETLSGNLENLRKENETKLEQMRLTVEEKLQGTLDQRLGESFKLVSERLEAVHKGLGEMQTLASGVGDLKRVLTNVKSRGAWGEVQLGALLDEMLTSEQYERNVEIRRGKVVEFAIKLPGQEEGEPLYIPVDSKFPQEDYERLQAAQELGDIAAVEVASKALEKAVRVQAKTIGDSYILLPRTTDFAIMFLATEGLYAEIARRPGLLGELRTAHRIMVTGPSNLAALLTSLQMGFRTMAIQKRSSEVWKVLGAAKAAFQKYGAAIDAVEKKLDEAKKKVAEVGVRNRDVNRQLRSVESLEAVGVSPELAEIAGAGVLAIEEAEESEDA